MEPSTGPEANSSIKFLLVSSNDPPSGRLTLQRVFAYNDARGWLLNAVALACMVASGTVLPLMDVVFGKFVNVFNGFATGALSPADYRAEVSHYTCVLDGPVSPRLTGAGSISYTSSSPSSR